MKTFITLLFLAISTPFFAQSHVLVKHNGEKMNVNYIKTNNNLLYFNTGKDQVEQSISTFAVAELINTITNDRAKISDKIVVSGEHDYNKVILITPDATTGLSTIANNSKFINRVKGQTPGAVQQQNIMALKRKAAKEGIPFVSIAPINRAESTAKMYTY
ncbi:hypothetical protein [Flavobacterium succinicans]|uniref:Uncharacterized protein n=1 Tax=Flavobacterium succinicans TaxID=29536 RepID=A0A199XSX2_9FLAO|nr:hypothetical protein [Flavobacterium succinicans]OAZ04434.1 hypothetical protein FLB_14320 [Flavobacterium succinicans]